MDAGDAVLLSSRRRMNGVFYESSIYD
jgi:hypothetical protein